ncbi:5-azacytidine-induced protein 2 [Trichomycterus rosablanca]|uniref:5-azacytidine-induced protein 2 n=1 Tax=Trichomycterus rosablanca TaxID=2290929 RepID=UPI002F35ECD9
MESPHVDDDICILKHETAFVAESPVSVCSGDESVASHFALVTAYEDIKKRLRDTERENTLLRKRVKQLEDKLFRPEAPPSEGPQYMNKAFSAYRGIYMEKKDLQAELNKLKKERAESERILTEQLQAKELELLQLRSEMETSQVIKSLNETQDYWQVNGGGGGGGSDAQIHTLQQEVEKLRLENRHLNTLCNLQQDVSQSPGRKSEIQQVALHSSAAGLQVMRVFEEMSGEMIRIHELIRTQSEVMKRLREKPALRRAASTLPVQCLDDMERNHSPVRVPIPRPPSAPPTGPPAENWKETWPLTRPSPLGSPAVPPPHAVSSSSDDSWTPLSHPPHDHTLFWEGP